MTSGWSTIPAPKNRNASPCRSVSRVSPGAPEGLPEALGRRPVRSVPPRCPVAVLPIQPLQHIAVDFKALLHQRVRDVQLPFPAL